MSIHLLADPQIVLTRLAFIYLVKAEGIDVVDLRAEATGNATWQFVQWYLSAEEYRCYCGARKRPLN
jgi:hypothetical protein